MRKQVIFEMEEDPLKELKKRVIDKGLSMKAYLTQLVEKDAETIEGLI